MHKIIEWVKGHPKTSGAIFVGVLLMFVLLSRSGGKAASATIVTAQPTDTTQNTALMAAQLNAQVATNATNQGAAVQLAGINAAQTVQTTQSTNATTVALANIAATADTTKYVTDLGAQVANNQTAAAVSINDSQMSAATQIATITAQSNQALASITSQMNSDNNATALSLSDIAASVAKYQTDASVTVNAANNNAKLGLAGIQAGSIANAINISSADQWGGGFVNPGIANWLAGARITG